MLVDVILPKYGPNMLTGLIVRWLKRPGDAVRKGDELVEIMTEKVNTMVEAPADGVVSEILAEEEDEVPVGTVIAKIQAS